MEINQTFTAELVKSPSIGGWTYVIWPESIEYFNSRGAVKVSGKIDGHPFRATFMAMGNGKQMLPIKRETRDLIGKDVGDTVTVQLLERL